MAHMPPTASMTMKMRQKTEASISCLRALLVFAASSSVRFTPNSPPSAPVYMVVVALLTLFAWLSILVEALFGRVFRDSRASPMVLLVYVGMGVGLGLGLCTGLGLGTGWAWAWAWLWL